MKTTTTTKDEIREYLDNIQFLSPNEPITPQGIQRVIDQMSEATSQLEELLLDAGGLTINLWDPNITYSKDDIVLYFRQEPKQVSPEVGKRVFAFILVSTVDNNQSIPNCYMVDNLYPDFSKTGWKVLNPMSYLLQDLIGMNKVVKEVMENLMSLHVEKEHGLIGSTDDIGRNLLRRDYSNLSTSWGVGQFSPINSTMEIKETGLTGTMKKTSNGVMEYCLRYSLDEKANQQVKIEDSRHYFQKSPIWDESDQTIFSQKYIEDDMFSVALENGTMFNNLRYGTNVFHRRIDFGVVPFIDDEYMVFFDTYGNGEFVFGYDKNDLQEQTEPTYDAIVSMPMLMNKTKSGFDIVLPVHCHFNSIQKYNIGVPWNNVFTLQVIGRYR